MRNRILFLFFLMIGFNAAYAGPKEVLVELLTGVKQKAFLVGTRGDSVILAGQVNGQATTVRIPKARFKQILSLPDSTPIHLDSLPQLPSARPAVAETTSVTPQSDTTAADSTSEDQPEHPWLGHLVVLPPEMQGVDSNYIQTIQSFSAQLLRDAGGFPIVVPSASAMDSFQTPEALISHLRNVRALGLIASQWKMRGDSIQVLFRSVWTQEKPVRSLQGSRTIPKKDLSRWLLTPEPWLALEKAAGIPIFPKVEAPVRKQASVYVETDPEGAMISLAGQAPSCKAPCRIQLSADTVTRTTLWASWKVENHLWSGKSYLSLNPGDTAHALIKLEMAHAFVLITSQPSGAEIFPVGEIWSPSMRPMGRTPYNLQDFGPGEQAWRLCLPGYQDTVLRLTPDPTTGTSIQVVLKPVKDANILAQQAEQRRARSRYTLGKALTGASAGPLLAGTMLVWLAQDDFSNARTIRDQLEQPSAGNGPNYDRLVKENKTAVENGRNKTIGGLVLIGSGIILASIGVSIWF